MNELGLGAVPFLFIIDYEGKNAIIEPLDNIDSELIKYNFCVKSNDIAISPLESEEARRKGEGHQFDFELNSSMILFNKFPLPYDDYKKSFDIVMNNIYDGNSYLCNLTAKTPIETNLSLNDIYRLSNARYKMKYKDDFVFFSPETFVKIIDGHIYSYPMKGTIDADIPNAEEILLNDDKEKAEHITIVDLIRNDLSILSKNVEVTKFRYIDKIKTNDKNLLQVSSEIKGILPNDYKNKIGEIIFSLLPAGSITGAPKKKTVEIIKQAENYERNFYTGIAGIFDGENLDSCVMIRFIEQEEEKLYFKSGGGITYQSNPEAEYKELIDKVYLPIYQKGKK
ncbi:MAG: aminodeoxychorismate synthase component I [Melioribacteraceae bacterium]|nr:aminodeoxychorismate synthase component I [Melioribacteraceae bacterium]